MLGYFDSGKVRGCLLRNQSSGTNIYCQRRCKQEVLDHPKDWEHDQSLNINITMDHVAPEYSSLKQLVHVA